jgi:hypothetical protein
MSGVYESLGSIEGVSYLSEGELLIGVAYIGLGEGRKPTVFLLHGLPGLEKNVDIAYALREMGWNVLIPHYRGCWGSEGKYRFTSIPTDVKNAITCMLQRPYVDGENIFLVGHSLGAWAAIITSAQDKRVKGVVAIAGGATSSERSDRQRTYLHSLIRQGFLKNTTLQEALDDWERMAKELASQDWVEKISPRPFLIIGGEQDSTVAPDRVRAIFERAKEPKRLVIMEGADHVFTRKRKELVETVTSWLKTL